MDNGTNKIGDRKWTNLTREEQDELIFHYRANGKYRTEIVRAMSDILFNWLFILNSGGLLSIVTIFAASPSQSDLKQLCLHTGLCFVLGLSFIYSAARLEHYRFSKSGYILDITFNKLQDGNITVNKYLDEVDGVNTTRWLVTTLEYLSFISFFLGLAVGFYSL